MPISLECARDWLTSTLTGEGKNKRLCLKKWPRRVRLDGKVRNGIEGFGTVLLENCKGSVIRRYLGHLLDFRKRLMTTSK